jgi:hypothetical protein
MEDNRGYRAAGLSIDETACEIGIFAGKSG